MRSNLLVFFQTKILLYDLKNKNKTSTAVENMNTKLSFLTHIGNGLEYVNQKLVRNNFLAKDFFVKPF